MKLILDCTTDRKTLEGCDLADFECTVEGPEFSLQLGFDLHYEFNPPSTVRIRSFGAKTLRVTESRMESFLCMHNFEQMEPRIVNLWFLSHFKRHREQLEPQITQSIERCRIMSSCYS